MPTPLVLSYAKRSRKPVEAVEKIWDRAKDQAKAIRRSDIIDKDYWRLVNGLVKKELGLNESLTFKNFLSEGKKIQLETGLTREEAMKMAPWKKSYGDCRGFSYDSETGIASWV